MRFFIIRAWNWIRGYRFFWKDGALECTEGTCPYPLLNDWSVKACVRAGKCGCGATEPKS